MTTDPRLRSSPAKEPQTSASTASSLTDSATTPASAGIPATATKSQGASTKAPTSATAGPSSSSSSSPTHPAAATTKSTRLPVSRKGKKSLPWCSFENDVLKEARSLHGGNWAKMASHFAKRAPQNQRSLAALKQQDLYQRYGKPRRQRGPPSSTQAKSKHTSVHASKAPQPVSSKTNNATSQGGSSSSQQASASSSTQAADKPGSSSSLSSPPSTSSTLPTASQATSHTIRAGKTFTQAEETQLLQIALRHSSESDILTQVRTIYRDFTRAFPSSTWAADAVHIKYRQLLQVLPEDESSKESEAGEGEHVDGGGEAGTVIGAAEGANATLTKDGAEKEKLYGAAPFDVKTNQQHQVGPGSPEESKQSAYIQQRLKTPPSTTPHESPQHGNALSPAVEAAPSKPAPQDLAITPPLDLNYRVVSDGRSFRFIRPPRCCSFAIHSPSEHSVRYLPKLAVQGNGEVSAEEVIDEQDGSAAFLFYHLPAGVIQDLALPPGTQKNVFTVPDEQTGGFSVEVHFISVDAFSVSFSLPL